MSPKPISLQELPIDGPLPTRMGDKGGKKYM